MEPVDETPSLFQPLTRFFLSVCRVVGWRQLTVPTALVDRRADPASVKDGGADVVPLDIVGVSDVIVDLKY